MSTPVQFEKRELIQVDCDILPLVSDALPHSDGLIAMLKVYMDRSAKRDTTDEVMCVASVIFKPTAYKQFVRHWNRMLKAWGADTFHAKEFYPGSGIFKRDTAEKKLRFEEDSRRIPEMIAKAISRILIVSFRPAEFMASAPEAWKAFGDNLHSLAVQACLLSNGDWLKNKKCSFESFAYFMESGDEGESEVLRDVARLRSHEKTAKHIKVASFTTVNKGVAKGLEAADCVAWHWNKYYMDSVRPERVRYPRKDFLFLANAARGKCQCIFASGDDLKYLFSLSEQDGGLRISNMQCDMNQVSIMKGAEELEEHSSQLLPTSDLRPAALFWAAADLPERLRPQFRISEEDVLAFRASQAASVD